MTEKEKVIQNMDAASEERVRAATALRAGAHVHISGVCGTGMAAVAVLLRDLGFHVTGSDKAFYPPMGDVVRGVCERVFEGYAADNLSPRPDFVVIGNSLRRENPEAVSVREEKIPFASMPEIFSGLLIGTREHCRYSVVVAGTHGKTTTAAATATLLDVAGRKPGYFIGGAPLDLPSGIRAVDASVPASQRVVVLEGDEYDSAYFAKWPKFHSYRPDILVATSLEFDHADIYDSVEEIEEEFAKLFRRVPADGVILVADNDPRLRKIALNMRQQPGAARVEFYGYDLESMFRIERREPNSGDPECRQKLVLRLGSERFECSTPLSGAQNAANLLASASVASLLGVAPKVIAKGVSQFHGVKRRQQTIVDTGRVTVLEDFAHHPTAVDLTLRGIQEVYQGRRLVAVFEPRSNTSRRAFFQEQYAQAFSAAQVVVVREVEEAGGYSGTKGPVVSLDVKKLVRSIAAEGKTAQSFSSVDALTEYLKAETRPGDVIVLMSNGDFGGLPEKLKTLFGSSRK